MSPALPTALATALRTSATVTEPWMSARRQPVTSPITASLGPVNTYEPDQPARPRRVPR